MRYDSVHIFIPKPQIAFLDISLFIKGNVDIWPVVLAIILLCLLVIAIIVYFLSRSRWLKEAKPTQKMRDFIRVNRPALKSRPSTIPPANYASVPSTIHQRDESALQNTRWLSLAEECVALLSELEQSQPDLNQSQQDLAQHVVISLQEILVRSGVQMIVDDTAFDYHRHRLTTPKRIEEGTPISVIIPGFAVGRRILRPARVSVNTLPTDDI